MPGCFGLWPCPKRATTLRAGKPYCTIHDPDRIAAKREEKSAAFGAEVARRRRVAEKLIARERITETAINAVNEEFGWQPVIDAVRAWRALP